MQAALIIFCVSIAIVVQLAWSYGRSGDVLDTWAAKNGYTIVSREFRWMFKGPYAFVSGKGQVVYRIKVVDAAGQQRSGWARCGGYILGLLSDKIDVTWDD